MTQTTSQILGKAHKLCEWLREDDLLLYEKISTVPLSYGVEDSTKWHVGNVDDLPAGLDREVIDSLPLHLPVKKMLIEFEMMTIMGDGRSEPSTGFILCYDKGDEVIDCFFMSFCVDKFSFFGGCKLFRDQNTGCRKLGIYEKGATSRINTKLISNGVTYVERTLVALGCTNVISADNNPPSSLNKKRIKQGKLPVFTYKTLHVISGKRAGSHSYNTNSVEVLGGVRLHFRRGHIRRLADGRITWVQQCMVGNKAVGVIEKSYALLAQAT